MKKNFLLFLLVALMTAPVLTSCKKGANDPFLTLKSRKGRLTGEWVLKEGTITNLDGSDLYTTTFTDNSVTYSLNGSSSTYAYTENMTINKDFTYEISITEDGDAESNKGSWSWLGKNKKLDLKNKEAFVFVPETLFDGSDTDLYSGLYFAVPKVIDQLKNKELIIKIEESSTSGGVKDNYEGTLVYQKK